MEDQFHPIYLNRLPLRLMSLRGQAFHVQMFQAFDTLHGPRKISGSCELGQLDLTSFRIYTAGFD